MEILHYNPRQSGKTTRLIDFVIQRLFTFGKVHIPLHVNTNIEKDFIIDEDANSSNSAQMHFVDRLLKRLSAEHFGYFKHETINNVLIITTQNQLRENTKNVLTQEEVEKFKTEFNKAMYGVGILSVNNNDAEINPTKEQLKKYEQELGTKIFEEMYLNNGNIKWKT